MPQLSFRPTATNDPFVYRLGLQVFILARRVQLPYGSPFFPPPPAGGFLFYRDYRGGGACPLGAHPLVRFKKSGVRSQKISGLSGPTCVCLILLESDLFGYLRYAPVVVKKCH